MSELIERVWIINQRISEGYHTYKLYAFALYTNNQLKITESDYGDLAYWGESRTKSIDEAIDEIISNLGITRDEWEWLESEGKINWINCGFFEELTFSEALSQVYKDILSELLGNYREDEDKYVFYIMRLADARKWYENVQPIINIIKTLKEFSEAHGFTNKIEMISSTDLHIDYVVNVYK